MAAQHGGQRKGAGRKPKPDKGRPLPIRVPPDLYDAYHAAPSATQATARVAMIAALAAALA